jgi:hypothetical protein
MPETPFHRKAIMPNKHHAMKKNCRRCRRLEIKLRASGALFPFLSFSVGTALWADSGD